MKIATNCGLRKKKKKTTSNQTNKQKHRCLVPQEMRHGEDHRT